MAVDMFLKLGDIKGESLAVGHTEEIEVLSWSWGCSQMGTTHTGTPRSSARTVVPIPPWVIAQTARSSTNSCGTNCRTVAFAGTWILAAPRVMPLEALTTVTLYVDAALLPL